MSKMIENSSNSVEKIMCDVGVVVKDHISRLIFKINDDNKSVQDTIEYLKKMPIIVKLERELEEAREEITNLTRQLNKNEVPSIELTMQELDINSNINKTNYKEISQLVTDKVNEKEKTTLPDFTSMYFNNQESDDEDEDEDDDDQATEKKTPIVSYKHFLGLPKLDLDGAECSNEDEDDIVEQELAVGVEDATECAIEGAEVDQEMNAEEVEDDETDETYETDDIEEEEHEKAEEEDDHENEDAEEEAEEEDDAEEEAEEEDDAEEEHEDVESDSAKDDEISEEELEVDEIEINGKLYFTTDENDGILYDVDSDGDIGDEVGCLKNGKAFFS